MGKPDPIIYNVALDMLQLPTESIVAIGDSLQHDIQGMYEDILAVDRCSLVRPCNCSAESLMSCTLAARGDQIA